MLLSQLSASYIIYIFPLLLLTILSYFFQRPKMRRKVVLVIPALLFGCMTGYFVVLALFKNIGFGGLIIVPAFFSVFSVVFFIIFTMLSNKLGWLQAVVVDKNDTRGHWHPLRYFFFFMLLVLGFTTLNYYNDSYYKEHAKARKDWPVERLEQHANNPLAMYNSRIVYTLARHNNAPEKIINKAFHYAYHNNDRYVLIMLMRHTNLQCSSLKQFLDETVDDWDNTAHYYSIHSARKLKIHDALSEQYAERCN